MPLDAFCHRALHDCCHRSKILSHLSCDFCLASHQGSEVPFPLVIMRPTSSASLRPTASYN
jgi:hypothetical protein